MEIPRNRLKWFSSIYSIFEISEEVLSTIDINFSIAQLWVLPVYPMWHWWSTVKDWFSLLKTISFILFRLLKRLFWLLFMVLNFCLEVSIFRFASHFVWVRQRPEGFATFVWLGQWPEGFAHFVWLGWWPEAFAHFVRDFNLFFLIL